MNRMTKAMARLGTMAVIAGVALSAPFAVGTASAAATVTATTTNGVPAPGAVAAAFASSTTFGTFTITGGVTVGDAPTLTLNNNGYWDPADPGVISGGTKNVLTAPCTGLACNGLQLKVDDGTAETTTVAFASVPAAQDTQAAVGYNGAIIFAAVSPVTATTANTVNGAATTTLNASTFNAGTSPGTFVLSGGNTPAAAGDTVQIALNSTHAYFITADPGRTSPTTATCTAGATGTCATQTIGDAYPESVLVTVVDITTPADTASSGFTVLFNSIFFTTCGTSSGPTPPGIEGGLTGTAVAPSSVVGGNSCVSQLQTGVVSPQTVEYEEGGAAKGGQSLFASISNGASVQFASPTGASDYQLVTGSANKQATCSTDPAGPTVGTCTFQLVDNNTLDVGSNVQITVELNGPALDYIKTGNQYCDIDSTAVTTGFPMFPATGTCTIPPLTAATGLGNATQEAVNVGAAPTPPGRVNLISATLIAPGSQVGTVLPSGATGTGAPAAEPGDAIQLQYQLLGTCTPNSTSVNCDNKGGATALATPDAGIPLALKVDHGFFTQNCDLPNTTQGNPIPAPSNNYANCSFSTTPAPNGQVGALTNSGTTQNVTTDNGGYFTVTIGIGRDAAFDGNGLVVAHVTASTTGTPATTFAPLQPNALPTTATCPSGGESVQPLLGGVFQLLKGSDGTLTAGQAGCQEDVVWTTRETPLNGGKASLVVIPPLSSPNNVSINTENNYTATDTGTVNVPDTGRVVFVVHALDQFGNLTSDVGDSNNLILTKSGPGQTWVCPVGGDTATDACPGGLAAVPPATVGLHGTDGNGTAQADGTTVQVDKAVQASYLNDPQQARYQADAAPYGPAGGNDGYTTTTPSVDDGTTTVVLTWAPQSQQFKSFSPVVVPTAAVAQYQTITPAAATSTDTYTLNFYNQLAQPVITFAVSPSNTVATSTGVTVTATVVDQFKNPLVGVSIDALRSGANEASCVPIQNVGNGGGAGNILTTNTSGSAAYTFSCDAPGASTVTMVVQGYGQVGGSQISLARGTETVHFGGKATPVTVERPTVSLTSFHRHHLTVNVHTDPALGSGRTVNIYRLVNGIKNLVGQTHTGAKGNGTLTFRGLRQGATWRVSAKVIGLGVQYRSEFASAASHRIK